MSDAFWTHLPLTLTAIGTIISVLVGLWNNRKITEVHKATDGLTTALVKAEKIVSFDAGVTAADARQDLPASPRPIAPEQPPKIPHV